MSNIMREDQMLNRQSIGRFDWVINGKKRGPNANCDIEMYRDEKFSVIPSLGSIVPGWTLIVPRVKALSLLNLSKNYIEDLDRLTKVIQNQLDECYTDKSIVKFEHGPCMSSTLTGCGIDQAHLHLVPLERNFEEFVLKNSKDDIFFKVDPINPWREIELDRDYYLLWVNDSCYIGYPKNPVSQHFRRLIADFTSNPSVWDYKKYPYYDNIKDTIERFGSRVRY